MNVLLAPVGTRGDVQPMLALALELRRRGHAVTMAAPANFKPVVGSYELRFAPSSPSYSRFTDELKVRPFLEVLRDQMDGQFAGLLEASQQADLIVGSMLQLAGPSVAEHRGIPYCFMHPAPVFIRSDEHPPVTEANQELSPAANLAAWSARGEEWSRVLGPALAVWRNRLGLPPVADVQDHVMHSGHLLLACEPALAGTPRFAVADVETTGAWYLDEGTLAPEIEQFCAAGETPLFVGFGSMRFRPAAELFDIVFEAAELARVRCVVGAGWSDLPSRPVPSSCLVIQEAPFHLLMPLMRAAIHHGGAGTVHAVARAGIPQGIVPHFADQPYWGRRILRLGLGPAPVLIHDLTAAKLAQMMSQLAEDPSFATQARAIGRRIDPGAGIARAAEAVEQQGQRRSPSRVWEAALRLPPA
jgi:vancomycin aglycone glucosyltransferase